MQLIEYRFFYHFTYQPQDKNQQKMCRNLPMSEYLDIYLKYDILQLADNFENLNIPQFLVYFLMPCYEKRLFKKAESVLTIVVSKFGVMVTTLLE